MKKSILLFTIIALFAVFSSCKKELPYCELYNYGMVTVENQTGYDIWTDVTWGEITLNDERFLTPRASYQYVDVPSGSIEIWISFDGEEWSFEYETLGICEDLTFTWYLGAKKSANGCPFVIDIGDGKLHVPILKNKHLD